MKNVRESKKRYVVLPIVLLIAVAAAFFILLAFTRGCADGRPISTFVDSDGHRIALYRNGETRDLGTTGATTRIITTDAVMNGVTTQVVTTEPVTTAKEAKTYTVTFLDYSGAILGRSVVEKGGTAVPPPDPLREGYIFTGWSGQLFNVTASKTVTAKYAQIDSPNVFDISYTVGDGRLTVNLKIDGKVAIAGAEGVLTLPDFLKSPAIVAGSGVYAEQSGQDIFFVFASRSGKNQTSDKELLSLSFDGELPEAFDLSLSIGDAFDQNFENVPFSVIGQRVFLGK